MEAAKDGSERNGAFKSYVPSAENVVLATDTSGRRILDRLLEAGAEHDVIVADLPSGILRHFVHWFTETQILAAAEQMGVELVMLLPVCAEREAMKAQKRLWEAIGEDAQKRLKWVVAKNGKDGPLTGYEAKSGLREAVLAAGGEEIEFPSYVFTPRTVELLKLEQHTFPALMASKEVPALEKYRLDTYLKTLHAQFSALRVIQPLLPPAPNAATLSPPRPCKRDT